MNLDLSDAEAEALTQELAGIIDGGRIRERQWRIKPLALSAATRRNTSSSRLA
jgi:hypothetical protein